MKKRVFLAIIMTLCVIFCLFVLSACVDTGSQGNGTNNGINNGTNNGTSNGNGTSSTPSGGADSTLSTAGLEYKLTADGDGYEVNGIGTATDKKIVIPSTHEGKPVVGIADEAFRSNYSVTGVTIKDGLKYIGKGAFEGCNSLKDIHISGSVASIADNPFIDCEALATITVDDENEYYHADGNCLIETLTGKLTVGCKNSKIPTDGSVTSIGAYAFSGCENLVGIEIPNAVTVIGEFAFYACKGLKSITVPNGVEKIENSTFSNCTSLVKVVLPEGLVSLGMYAFNKCTALTAITLPNSITAIYNGVFSECTALKSLEIPNSVTYVGSFLCENCTALTSLTIGDGVKTLYSNTIVKCTKLTSLTLGKAVAHVYPSAFEGSTAIKSLTAPTNAIDSNMIPMDNLETAVVTDSGEGLTSGSFKNATKLKSVKFLPAVTKGLSGIMFYGCTALTTVTVESGNPTYYSAGNCVINSKTKAVIAGCKNSVIPADGSIEEIETSAFEGCSALSAITIPQGIKVVGNSAFRDCTSLKSIVIPEGTIWIGQDTFRNCSSLTKVIIPQSVSTVSSWAFRECYQAKFYCRATQKPSGWDSFWNETSCSVTWGYQGT